MRQPETPTPRLDAILESLEPARDAAGIDESALLRQTLERLSQRINWHASIERLMTHIIREAPSETAADVRETAGESPEKAPDADADAHETPADSHDAEGSAS